MTPRQAALLLAVAALWGGSYLLIKYALEDFSAPFIVAARTALAAGVLLALIRWRGGPGWAALLAQRRRPALVLAIGASAITVPFLLITYGEHEVPSGLTAVLIAAAPIFVAVLAPFLDPSERVTRTQALGVAMGFAGVALLVGVESVSTAAQLLGALAMVGAAACYALSSLMVKRTMRGVPSLVVSFVAVGAGALLALPAGLAALPSEAPGWRAVMAVGVLGMGSTALAFVLFYRLLAEVGAGRAALVSYLAPALALFYGALLLDERITPAGLAGLALILAGVFVASRAAGGGSPVEEPADDPLLARLGHREGELAADHGRVPSQDARGRRARDGE